MTQAHPQGVGSDAVRVLVCDDFVVMRAALARALESDPAIRVVARVADGKQALAEVQRQTIDVVVLDIEMPVMDGLTALPRLMRAAPRLRVLMASTLTTRGAEVTLQALRLGAADYVAKPSAIAGQGAELFRRELLDKVRALAPRRPRPANARSASQATPATPRPAPVAPPRLLAIGSSTGGPARPVRGTRTRRADSGGPDPTHACRLHAHPRPAHHPRRRPALWRSRRRRGVAARMDLSGAGRPAFAG